MNEIGKATRRRRVSSTYGRELGMYLRYVAALVRPGVKMPVFDAHRLAPGDLSTWNDEEKMDLLSFPWVALLALGVKPCGGAVPAPRCPRQAVACRCCRQAPGLEARGQGRVPVMVRV